MKILHRMTWGLLLTATTAFAQTAPRVGVGTTTPRAGLDVNHDDGLIVTGQGPDGQYNPGPGNIANLPTGAGTRLLWIPAKAAFRAGKVVDDAWNPDNVGVYSVAMGINANARGSAAVALGYGTTASGEFATATGYGTQALNMSATALGNRATASGIASVALGNRANASGNGAMALGSIATASGTNTLATGFQTTASGNNSTALGNNASTAGQAGSFVVGDLSTGTLLASSVINQFSARFAGGYRLFSDSDMSVGVSLASGGNAWQTISDSTKKEGFRSADGASFLRKIAGMRLGSWNYRGQDARTMRHYGPMAQDFFAAFGRDGVGTIGTDTTLNGADFDGINLIAIQALVRENQTLKARLERLEAERTRSQAETADLRRLLGQLATDMQGLKATASR